MKFLSLSTFLAFVCVGSLSAPLLAHSTGSDQGVPTPKSQAVEYADQSLSVSRYWARPGKKGQNTAAYMILENKAGLNGMALVKATSSVCREVQIHTTLEETIEGNLVKKMRQVDKIDLPAHQEVALAPGGYHIMLIGLTRDVHLQKEETIDLTLSFEGGKTIALALPIKKKPCSCCEKAAKKKAQKAMAVKSAA